MNLALKIPEKKPWNIFSSISLKQLNSKAALLERIDKKYIVKKEVLVQALEQWSAHFNILKIHGKSSFSYVNCYFDDEKYSCFAQHRQGKRIRFKVRTRHYIDSNQCFVEIKVKGRRGRTIKKRMPYSSEKARYLDADALGFVKAAYTEAYGRPFVFKLNPVLSVQYQRTTLVAVKGKERITIDTQVQFTCDKKCHSLNADTAIIETKTIKQRGIARKILKNLHQHPVSKCSKYCLGLILLAKVNRYNRFLKTIRKLY